jgi:hypothetical protein
MQDFALYIAPHVPPAAALRRIRLATLHWATGEEWWDVVERDAPAVRSLFRRAPTLQTVEVAAPWRGARADFAARLRAIEDMWNEELGDGFAGRLRLTADEPGLWTGM